MKRLFVTAAAIMTMATSAHAQAPFADVPREHWAYDAVNTLAQRGLVIGYPDGTFGGKRAMTRYEFAVVIARMLPQLEEFIRREVANRPAGGGTVDTSNLVTREDFDRLRRLVEEFGPELQALRVDVDNLRRQLDDVTRRVGILEDEVGRVKFSGEANMIARMSSQRRGTLAAGGNTMDLDGRTLNQTNNLLEASQIFYDLDLGITARVAQGITANALLNIGNYVGGFHAAPRADFPYGWAGVGSLNSQITPWKAYIEAPISMRPLGLLTVQAGKTGVQFTPYTLKLVDHDSYTNITKTDNGEVIFTGAKANFRVGGVGFTAYAGTHATQVGASGFPLFVTTNFTPRAGNPLNQTPQVLFPGIPSSIAEISQSAGIRATLGTPFGGTLGLTYLEGGTKGQFANNGVTPVDRAQVFGADLNLNLSRGIGLAAEFASSNLLVGTGIGDREGVYPRDLRNAYDARLSFGLGGVALSAGYKRVDPFFGAPGYWGALGQWKNPTNIEGFTGTASYAFSPRMSLAGSYSNFDSVITGFGATPLANGSQTNIEHFTAGLKFGLTSTNRVDLGVEQVRYERFGADAKERWYNIGLGHSLNQNASLKLLYQIADFDNHFLTAGDARGDIATAQLQVKF